MKPLSQEQQTYIIEATTYHEGTPEQKQGYDAINRATAMMLTAIFQYCPPCADRTDALRKARETRMMANAAIACNGLQVPRG